MGREAATSHIKLRGYKRLRPGLQLQQKVLCLNPVFDSSVCTVFAPALGSGGWSWLQLRSFYMDSATLVKEGELL